MRGAGLRRGAHLGEERRDVGAKQRRLPRHERLRGRIVLQGRAAVRGAVGSLAAGAWQAVRGGHAAGRSWRMLASTSVIGRGAATHAAQHTLVPWTRGLASFCLPTLPPAYTAPLHMRSPQNRHLAAAA